MGITKLRAFTLIEIVVAVGVVGFILPAVFNIFFSMARQQLTLIALQEIKQQGDSAERNIKYLLQERAAYISDEGFVSTDICPIYPLPTPTKADVLYIKDRDGNTITLSQTTVNSKGTISSQSAEITHNLTSTDVSISNFAFTCKHINDFTPAIVSVSFVANKSATFKEVSLPYMFNVRLRNY